MKQENFRKIILLNITKGVLISLIPLIILGGLFYWLNQKIHFKIEELGRIKTQFEQKQAQNQRVIKIKELSKTIQGYPEKLNSLISNSAETQKSLEAFFKTFRANQKVSLSWKISTTTAGVLKFKGQLQGPETEIIKFVSQLQDLNLFAKLTKIIFDLPNKKINFEGEVLVK